MDIAKGVALIAVIIGHTNGQGMPQAILNICFSFHMPLFFIVSGYFFHETRLSRDFVKKNAKALLIPYAVTAAIALLLIVLREIILSGTPLTSAAGAGKTWIIAAFYGAGSSIQGMPNGVVSVGAIWFLLALFWARLLLALAHETPHTGVAILALFAIGYATSHASDPLWLPFSVQAGMCATLFVYLGEKMHEGRLFELGALSGAVWALLAVIWAFVAWRYGRLYMVSNTYNGGVVDVIGGVAGSMVVIKASMHLGARLPRLAEPLRRLGLYSLPVFCMHLVELKASPWGQLNARIATLPVPTWASGLVIRVAIISVLTACLYWMPRAVAGIFFPGRRPERDKSHRR